jgi:hypothetical protein
VRLLRGVFAVAALTTAVLSLDAMVLRAYGTDVSLGEFTRLAVSP